MSESESTSQARKISDTEGTSRAKGEPEVRAGCSNEESDRTTRGRGSKYFRRGGHGRNKRVFKRHSHGSEDGFRNKRRRMSEMPFLLGGNSRDPLNLRSVQPVDEAENMKPIEIIIPKNIHDPLNLRNVNKNRNKRKRRSSRAVADEGGEGNEQAIRKRANTFAGVNDRRPDDPIVSPVPMSVVRKYGTNFMKKALQQRTRTVSTSAEKQVVVDETKGGSSKQVADPPKLVVEEAPAVSKKSEPNPEVSSKKLKNNKRFRYGNYDRYYGTRLQGSMDSRMQILKMEWFKGKSVLDIGCNVGYLTLSIAKEFEPRRIIGIDIDEHLVGVARKNIRHYCDNTVPMAGIFPASFTQASGSSTPCAGFTDKFPDNVWFHRENYILESEKSLKDVREEYDVILALSITKWIHLNWGDEGIELLFKRAYRQLLPGGLFVLESQSYDSYQKKAKLLVKPEMKKTYASLKLLPRAFEEYLIKQVGFESGTHIAPPKAKTKGFDRPICIFKKKCYGSTSKADQPIISSEPDATCHIISQASEETVPPGDSNRAESSTDESLKIDSSKESEPSLESSEKGK